MDMTTPTFRRRDSLLGLLLAASMGLTWVTLLPGCDAEKGNLFTRVEVERHLASALRLSFNQAVDASNLAVMADTDEASRTYAAQAADALKAAERDAQALLPVLRTFAGPSTLEHFEAFQTSFQAYLALDRTILELAVANTNLKAQRLSTGPGREAATAFREALEALGRELSANEACRAWPLIHGAVSTIQEMQILQAPHIAEAGDDAMSRMEAAMGTLQTSAQAALRDLATPERPEAAPRLAAANAALQRFLENHAQIIELSRRNTNVRSLALSLGEKRPVTTACDASLASLADDLAREGLKATR